MKRILNLTFGLLVLAVGSSQASSTTGLGEVGLHGGLNFSDTKGALALSPTAGRTEFIMGGFYESPGDFLHLQVEFNYVAKTVANYLAIPILLKIKIDGPVVRPFVIGGPAFALNVNGPTANGVDLSLDVGGGVEIELMPKVAVVAEGRYSLGFVNVSSTTTDIRTRGLYLMAGLAFSL